MSQTPSCLSVHERTWAVALFRRLQRFYKVRDRNKCSDIVTVFILATVHEQKFWKISLWTPRTIRWW